MRGIALLAGIACAMLSSSTLADGYHDFNAGVAASQFYNAAQAITLLSSAIAAPDLPDALRPTAYRARGEQYAQTGKLDAAIADFTSAIKLDPNDPDAYLDRSVAYAKQYVFDKAIADCTAAIQLQPKNWRLRIRRLDLYIQTSDLDDAISDYSEFIAARKPDASLLEGRADLYRAKLEFDKALSDGRSAIDVRPTAYAYEEIANTYLRLNDFKNALDSANSAIDRDEDNPERYAFRGDIQWAMGDFAAAAASYKEALSRGPHSDYVFMQLFIADAKQGAKVPDGLAAPFYNASTDTWPGQLVGVYLGRYDPDKVLSSALVTQHAARGARCAVGFYLGEWYVTKGDAAKAKQTLHQAVEDLCKDDPYQSHLASIDLARIQ